MLIPSKTQASAAGAHNLLSATHSDSLAGTVVRGDVIVGNSTPKWSRLAVGSALDVLAVNAGGTDPEWTPLGASHIQSGTFADARIAESNVTQHEAALTILETQIADGSLLARLAAAETVAGAWIFDAHLTLKEIAAPGTPATGYAALYVKSDGKLYLKDDAGTETDLTQGGGGGASELDDLSDVALTSVARGDLLVRNATEWVNLAIGANLRVLASDGTDPAWTALTDSHIPNLPASKITTGQLALARGGTGADLSATGGANQIVRQNSAGGAFTVSALAAADIPNLAASKINSGTFGIARGGTGISSYTVGDLIYASGTTTLAKLAGHTAATRRFLRALGTGSAAQAPAWDALVAGDIPDLSATYALAGHDHDSDYQPLDAILTDLSGITFAQGDVLYYDGANLVKLAAGDNGDVLTLSSGVPSWATPGGGTTHELLSATHTDTVAASPVLGDLIVGNSTPAWQRLAGNTTSTKKFLNQTGNGTISALPSWDALAAGDIPDLSGTYSLATHDHDGDYQPLDAELTALAGLTSAADRLPYFTGSGTAALATFTSFARQILDDADAATVRATLDLEPGTDVQAFNANLASLSGITLQAGDVLYATGAGTLVRLGIGTAGQVLTVNAGATAPEWDDAAAGGSAAWESGSGLFSAKTTGGIAAGDAFSFVSRESDGGTQVAHVFDTENEFTTTAKLVSFRNQTSEKLAIDKDGNLVTVGAGFQIDGATGNSEIALNCGSAREIIFKKNGAEVARLDHTHLRLDNGVVSLKTGTAPSSAASYGKMFVDSADGLLYYIDPSGNEFDLTAGAGGTLGGLSDVTISSPANGDQLVYNAGTWFNTAPNANLVSISALGSAADKMLYTTGVEAWAEADLTSFARNLLDDGDAATARATLGAGQKGRHALIFYHHGAVASSTFHPKHVLKFGRGAYTKISVYAYYDVTSTGDDEGAVASDATTIEIEACSQTDYDGTPSWTSIFSTALTIDASEESSNTAASAAAFTAGTIAEGTHLRMRIAGGGTAGKNLYVVLVIEEEGS